MSNIPANGQKSIAGGVIASLIAFVAASWVSYEIMSHTSSTPLAKVMEFLAINPHNPLAFVSTYYRRLALPAEYEDGFIVTPIVMLVAGLVLGFFARLARVPASRAANIGAVLGVILTVLIFGLPWLFLTIAKHLQGPSATQIDALSLTPMTIAIALTQLGLYMVAYSLGAWVVARRSTKPAPSPSNSISNPPEPQAKPV